MSIQISNLYNENQKRKILHVEKSVLYEPVTEWTYSHHASITHFKGKFYAIWSNGRVNEDDLGQRVLISSSSDFHHWSKPLPLVDSLQGNHSEVVLTAAGFHQYNDTLIAYFGLYEYQPDNIENGTYIRRGTKHQDTALFALTTKDGVHWTEPQNMHIPIVPNHGPQALSSGRLLISGNIMFPYTDDPSGLSGWTASGIYDKDRFDRVLDDPAYFGVVKEKMGWPVGLCEGSFYETKEGLIRMLLRSGSDRLWVTESGDDGMSWSPPQPTEFSDNVTKFHFGKLPDGRTYYVGCPDPQPKGVRNPLVLSLSEDGVLFNRHYILGNEQFVKKVEGKHKGGHYGYPHTLIHDGYLYCIFSIWKEGVAVIRTHLSQFND